MNLTGRRVSAEPFAGPDGTAIIRQGSAILLVERNAHMALTIVHWGSVIQTGEIVLHDSLDD